MQKQFYLAKNGAHVGPFSFEEVFVKINAAEYQWTDYVYDDTAQDWVMLMEHPDYSSTFSEGLARPTTKTPKSSGKTMDVSPEKQLRQKAWYTLREGNNYGPFSMMDLLQMLQEKTLFEYDYIWNESMTTWTRLAEVPEFHHDRVRKLKDSGDVDVSEVFFRRRHARVAYGCSLIVHNHKTLFRGNSFEISEGGAGVMIENKSLEPGQSLYLHFQPGDGVPPFNAVCSIVNKQWPKTVSVQDSTVKYGVKFTSISQSARQSIKEFAEKNKSAA